MQKPQLKFMNLIDNSATPFVPILKTKPNSSEPLPSEICEAQEDPEEFFRDWDEVRI